jgi:ABC-type multidrug transport system ATPase subunit
LTITESKEDKVMVVLKESSLALNRNGQQKLLELIRQIAPERNIAVLLCSHLLTETEHGSDDVVILNRGQVVARGAVEEVMGQIQRNNKLQNCMRIQVPPAAVLEARQVLDGMPNLLKLTRISEAEGWLEVELFSAANSNSINTYQINKILSALIRAKIPIISFAPEDGRLEDMSLNFARQTAS